MLFLLGNRIGIFRDFVFLFFQLIFIFRDLCLLGVQPNLALLQLLLL